MNGGISVVKASFRDEAGLKPEIKSSIELRVLPVIVVAILSFKVERTK